MDSVLRLSIQSLVESSESIAKSHDYYETASDPCLLPVAPLAVIVAYISGFFDRATVNGGDP
jgi:hypothetical protein